MRGDKHCGERAPTPSPSLSLSPRDDAGASVPLAPFGCLLLEPRDRIDQKEGASAQPPASLRFVCGSLRQVIDRGPRGALILPAHVLGLRREQGRGEREREARGGTERERHGGESMVMEQRQTLSPFCKLDC